MSSTAHSQRSTYAWTTLDRAGQLEFPKNDPAKVEIWGYTDQISYGPGEVVGLHVHTTAATYDVEIYRDGKVRELVHQETRLPGVMQTTPVDAYAVGCGWSRTAEVAGTSSWRSGVYVVVFRTIDEYGGVLERDTFFVLRSRSTGTDAPARTRIVHILPTPTYVAYNDWAGANSYRLFRDGRPTDDFSPLLSLQRPWARGFARLPIGAPRYTEFIPQQPGGQPRYPWLEWAFAHDYSRHYLDSGWAICDRPFSLWAEEQGFDLDVLTLHDIHRDPTLLDGYRLAILVGHDEYWTAPMRDAIDNFVDRGGNLARFAGNYLWQVRIEDDGKTQACYKAPDLDPLYGTSDHKLVTTFWESAEIGRPGPKTVGVSGVSGLYVRLPGAAPRHSGALTVYVPEHWAFEGTDVYYADSFGGHPVNIVSFETDGVDYQFKYGRPYPTGLDGVDPSFQILALAPTAGFYEEQRTADDVHAPATEAIGFLEGLSLCIDLPVSEMVRYGSAAMGIVERGKGTIFAVGCTEWVSGLIQREHVVTTVTTNVLRRLSGDPTASAS